MSNRGAGLTLGLASSSAHSPQGVFTPLLATALNGYAEAAGLLLDCGADIESTGYVSARLELRLGESSHRHFRSGPLSSARRRPHKGHSAVPSTVEVGTQAASPPRAPGHPPAAVWEDRPV